MRTRLGTLPAVLLAFGALPGCAAWRAAHPPPPPVNPPAATAETPPERAPSPGPSENTSPASTAEAPSADMANANTPPPCSCTKARAKPKPRPKPKVVHTEAPPQLPTAPVVAETPQGGLVDAQVKAMSVSVMSILGKRVKGAKGEDLGRVVDVLADASGRVRIAIIDFGGFLGVGNHRIAVDWPLLRFSPDGSDPSLLLSLSPEKVRTAPEYRDNPRPQTLMEPTSDPAASPPGAPGAPGATGPSGAPGSAPPGAPPPASAAPPAAVKK